MTDIDANVYKTLITGTQLWMKENLRTTRYSNGDLIGTTIPAAMDISSLTAPEYQWAYEGNESNAAIYGRLYTSYAVNDSRNICPAGWHVPAIEEWEVLTEYLINNGFGCGGSGKDIAKSLAATSGWSSNSLLNNVGNTQESNNSSGFTALPGGLRLQTGVFGDIVNGTYWWSSSTNNGIYSMAKMFTSADSLVYIFSNSRSWGLSVRCLRAR